jgi:hypothetical protein
MTREDLIARHTARWGFRPRGPFEGAQQYREAAIAFLETRDWAAAHEVRTGRTQADWTPDDTQAFHDRMTSRPMMANEPSPALFVDVAPAPCTVDALLLVARASIEDLATKRLKHVRAGNPQESLPVLAHVITLTERLLITTASSGNRLGVLRAAAQQLPLYGYVLVFDAFMHSIDEVKKTATKRDTLMAHVGTRDGARILLQRPYTIAGRTVTRDAENLIDMRAPGPGQPDRFVDPYAELFVSVPPVKRPQ